MSEIPVSPTKSAPQPDPVKMTTETKKITETTTFDFTGFQLFTFFGAIGMGLGMGLGIGWTFASLAIQKAFE